MKVIWTRSGNVLVDDEDYDLNMYRWCIRGGYCSRAEEGTRIIYYAHLIIGERIGLCPKNIDHIDRNKLNNQRENLRQATPTQNMMNVAILNTNKSGYKGVFWLKARNTWTARIKIGDKRVHLGLFISKHDAALAYDRAAYEAYGKYAWLNFPEITFYRDKS